MLPYIRNLYMVHVGFHNRLNSALGRVRPSLWFYINHIKDCEATMERLARNAEHGIQGPKRIRKWKKLDERITKLKADYVSGRRNLADYWRAISHSIHNFI